MRELGRRSEAAEHPFKRAPVAVARQPVPAIPVVHAVPLLIIIQTVLGAAGKPDIAGFLFEHGTLVHQEKGRRSTRDDGAPEKS